MRTEIEKAVEKAAEYMDENFEGWHESINEEIFDMVSCTHCIIGQLFKIRRTDSEHVLKFHNCLKSFPLELHPAFGVATRYSEVQAEWLRQIEKRKQKQKSIIPAFREGVSV